MRFKTVLMQLAQRRQRLLDEKRRQSTMTTTTSTTPKPRPGKSINKIYHSKHNYKFIL